MKRAIQLGANALGYAAPNPMVGAVLVHDNRIIGEGWTSPYGGPHAEVNAIASVSDKSLLSAASLYVTLEPCNHHGKTPPCTDLILRHGIPKIYVGLADPHPKVAGGGIKRLMEAGCQVVTGILEQACREHHRRFLCVHEKKRPYIILKWAQSTDGYLAPARDHRNAKTPYWISNQRSRQLVHRWRSEEQAILVGSRTVLADNPRLDTRLWDGPSPLRLILDPEAEVRGDYHVLQAEPPSVYFLGRGKRSDHVQGHEVEWLNTASDTPSQVCEALGRRGIISLLVEGGAQTLQSFITQNLWDEARLFTAPMVLGSGLKAPLITGRQTVATYIGNNSLMVLKND